jgi:uncharacterized damage-inducible protein DinB
MTIIDMFTKELLDEAKTTGKMLSCIPDDRYDWQPHEKSMTIRRLANHIAELPYWVGMALDSDELDLADNPYQPATYDRTTDLLEYFEKAVKDAKERLSRASEQILPHNWTLKSGEEILSVSTKGETLRMIFSQIIHHRAQLGVFLRLLNVPIPGSYGPSADEDNF